MASVTTSSTTALSNALLDDSLITKPVKKVNSNIIKPTPITDLYSYYGDITAEEFGGKAASLRKLTNRGCVVPMAWGLRCKLTFTTPKINFSNIPDEYKFAVRSGAPTSMPGLLQTKLGVSHADLQQAVEEVWASWNSPHAKAYREAKGIADTGTGVIIQQWIPSEFAGVVFTNDPNNVDEPDMFDPIIEYVEGQGEQLVSGAVQPKRAVANNAGIWYEYLFSWAKALHIEFGPSDIEWAWYQHRLYLLQWRKLKFADIKPNYVDKDDSEGRELIKKGKSIGSAKKAILKVVTDVNKFNDGDALYVGEFAAELYPYMMRSGAILCSTGGETCHAAIIARELGIIAISNIKYEEIKGVKKALISGITGCVYQADSSEKVEKVEVIVKPKKPILKPNLKLLETRWEINCLVVRFYDTLSKLNEKELDENEVDERMNEMAHLLSTYFYTIALCEMRHIKHMGSSVDHKHPLIIELQTRGCKIPTYAAVGRDDFKNEGVPQPTSLKRVIELLELCLKGYTETKWSASFGGNRWANITKLILAYFKGELSDTLFIDACFNLQHNGGRAFNKFKTIFCEESVMITQLDAKLKSHKRLLEVSEAVLDSFKLKRYLESPRLLEQPIYQPLEAEDPVLSEPARMLADIKQENYLALKNKQLIEKQKALKLAALEAKKALESGNLAKAATAQASNNFGYIEGCDCFECKALALKAKVPEEE